MHTKLAPVERAMRRTARRSSRLEPPSAAGPHPADARALAFLGDVLTGDARWHLAEVQKLAAMHTLAAIGHWHTDGLDGFVDGDPGAHS